METTDTSIYDILIWAGAALSLLGLAGLMWCILRVARAKRAKLDDAGMRDVLKSAIPINLGSLFLSTIGLMMVILGIFLS